MPLLTGITLRYQRSIFGIFYGIPLFFGGKIRFYLPVRTATGADKPTEDSDNCDPTSDIVSPVKPYRKQNTGYKRSDDCNAESRRISDTLQKTVNGSRFFHKIHNRNAHLCLPVSSPIFRFDIFRRNQIHILFIKK